MSTSPPRLALPLALAVLVVALAGCAAHRTPATAPVRELPESYDAAARQRASYGGASDVEASPADLVAVVETALPAAAGAVVEHDPALDEVARVVATTLAETSQFPAMTLTRWLLWHEGIVGQLSGVFGTYGTTWAPAAGYDEALRERAAAVEAPEAGVRRFGVARVVVAGRVGQAVVLADSFVALERLEKSAAAGEEVELEGRFLLPVDGVELFIDDAPTKVRSLPVEVDAEGRFTVRFAAPTDAGAHYLELTGYVGDGGDTPRARRWLEQIALFPIYVDAPLPVEPDHQIREPAPNPPDVATWPEHVLDRYNAARETERVPPLVLDKRLVALAEGYLEQSQGQRHQRLDGQLGARLAERGLAPRTVQQIGTRFEFLDEELWRLMRSPAMRATLLDETLTHVGLAFAPDEGPLFLGRTLLVRPVGKLDQERERAALFRRLQRIVRERGGPAWSEVEELHVIAQEYADSVCSGQRDPEDMSALDKEVQRWSRGRFSDYSVMRVAGFYVDPADRRNYAGVLERPASHVGIGVCQGRLEGREGQELVVFFTALER